MMDIELRSITEGDAEEVYRLIGLCNKPHGFLGPPPSPPIIRTYRGTVAVVRGRILGCALWSLLKRKPLARLQYICVAPMLRRQGIAARLMDAFEADADGRTCVTTVVETNVGMRAMVGRRGYTFAPPSGSTKRRIVVATLERS